MKQNRPKETQPTEAAEHLQNGDWESCYRIAEHLYAQGAYQEALSWYKKASLLPDCNPIVFFELGYLFQHGEGVASDHIEALKWYEKAASLGVPQAMYNLAYFYQNGLVVDQDIQRAAQLLREATSLMDRLQLERGSYDAWKAEYDAQLAEVKRNAEEKRVRSEDLELRNRELDIDLSAARREYQRLEKEAAQLKRALEESEKQCGIFAARTESAEDALRKEQKTRKEVEFMASVRQAQMEERLRTSDELITNLAREHNESFERVQSSYTAQIDRLQRAYGTDFTELQKAKEQLSGKNADLSRMLDGKMSELSALQEALQQLQTQFERERKWKRLAFTLAGIFGVLTMILFM